MKTGNDEGNSLAIVGSPSVARSFTQTSKGGPTIIYLHFQQQANMTEYSGGVGVELGTSSRPNEVRSRLTRRAEP
jgi:hypothetical protein